MVTPSCDCHRTTRWRTKSSTARQSSPTLDMGLIAGTYLHVSHLYSFTWQNPRNWEENERKVLSTSLFTAILRPWISQNNQLMKMTLRSGLSDYLHSSSFLCTSPFFEPILSLYLAVSCHFFRWLHHWAAWAARLTRITNVHVALVFLWCHKAEN